MRFLIILVTFQILSHLAYAQTNNQDSLKTPTVNYLKRSGNTMIGGSIALIAGTIGLVDATRVSNVKLRKVMVYGSYGLYGVAGLLFIMAGNDLVKASKQIDNKTVSFQMSTDGIGLVLRY